MNAGVSSGRSSRHYPRICVRPEGIPAYRGHLRQLRLRGSFLR